MKQADTPLNVLYKLICVITPEHLALLQDLGKQACCHIFFFFPQTIQPVTSLSHNRSAPFYRVLTVVFQYSFGMVTAHYKDECYLIWQDFSEGCTYISMGKPVYCILLGQTAADPLIAEPT